MCAGVLKNWREAATLILTQSQKSNVLSKLSPTASEVLNQLTSKEQLQVLFLKRNSNATFMPDIYVFPGGVAENADFSKCWLTQFGATTTASANKKFGFTKTCSENAPMFRRRREPDFAALPSEIAFRITAIRETFEESGVLIARKADQAGSKFNPQPTTAFSFGANHASQMQEWREKVSKNPEEFLALCKKHDIVPDVWSLYDWSNWLTPSTGKSAQGFAGQGQGAQGAAGQGQGAAGQGQGAARQGKGAAGQGQGATGQGTSGKGAQGTAGQGAQGAGQGAQGVKRFDAAFYICALGPKPCMAEDTNEVVQTVWISPNKVVENYTKNQLQLAPPQLYESSRLANFDSTEELLKFCQSRTGQPLDRWMAVPIQCADGVIYAFPGDSLYPQNPDFEGGGPILQRQETVQELSKDSSKLHRAVTQGSKSKGKGSKAQGAQFQLLCNLQALPHGQVSPKLGQKGN